MQCFFLNTPDGKMSNSLCNQRIFAIFAQNGV